MVTEAPPAPVANTPEAWSERARRGQPWDAAGWSEAGQTRRFVAALRHLDLRDGDTLLDFGSGPGRLAAFLPPGVEYAAYDWAAGMADRVAAENPSATVLRTLPGDRFDHVTAIGPFNLADGWSKGATWEQLAELFLEYTRRSLVVSLYRGNDPRCLRYTPQDLAWFVAWVGCATFAVDATYLPNDLLLVLRR